MIAPVTPSVRWNTSAIPAMCTSRIASGNSSPPHTAGHALAIPAREDVQQRLLHLGAEAEAARDRRRDPAVRFHRLGGPAAAVRDQRRGHLDPPQRSLPVTHPPEHELHQRATRKVRTVGVGAERDLVAELRGQLVGVGRAADPREHRHVVHGRALGVVHPDALREAERDPALAQHVFLRQPEAEVGRQRQGRDQLSQAQAH